MKTLLASALFAATVLLGGCSSDNTAAPVTGSGGGTVAQRGACTSTNDCEAPLQCVYQQLDAGNQCSGNSPVKGVCVAMGPCTQQTVCNCGGQAVTACVNPNYSTVAMGAQTCNTSGGGDGGSGGTTPVGDAAPGGSTSGG